MPGKRRDPARGDYVVILTARSLILIILFTFKFYIHVYIYLYSYMFYSVFTYIFTYTVKGFIMYSHIHLRI